MTSKKKLLLLGSALILLTSFVTWQSKKGNKEDGEIQWVSFEEAVRLNEKNPRKIFIDLYTNWCGWCKRMDATTFRDSSIVHYMNEKFYAVKFNAETRDTITFRGKKFLYNSQYRVNEFALSLMSGKIAGYPTSIYMDEKYNILTTISSYLKPDQLNPVLKYFGENTYQKTSWEEFQKSQQ